MTAVEYLVEQIKNNVHNTIEEFELLVNQTKEMEKQQIFLASNTSAKESYKAGQKTMNCGCYEILDATTYEEWLYEQFKSE